MYLMLSHSSLYSTIRALVLVMFFPALTLCASGKEKPLQVSKKLEEAVFDKKNGVPRMVADVSLYRDILDSGFLHAACIRHFPRKLPAGARLFFSPPFLQGGGGLQVEVPASKKEMEKIAAKYAGKSRLAGVPGEEGKGNGLNKERIICYFCQTDLEHPKQTWNEKDVIMVVVEDREGGFHWNHGSLAGIAFERDLGKIVYWAESW